MVAAAFQLPQEILAVEVIEFLQVSKNDTALPPQVLRKVCALHLRKVALDDVAQRFHVLPLCGHHLINDMPQFTANGKKNLS